MKRIETKEKALRSARRFLQTKGLNGFSFQDVADELGIRKASLHYYFQSKDDLISELLLGYQHAFTQWIGQYQSSTAEQKLKAMIRLYTELAGQDFKICPIGALSADFKELSSALQNLVLDLHHKQRNWLVQTIKQAQEEKYLIADLNPIALADIILSLVQGSLQVSRMRREQEIIRRNLTHVLGIYQK